MSFARCRDGDWLERYDKKVTRTINAAVGLLTDLGLNSAVLCSALGKSDRSWSNPSQREAGRVDLTGGTCAYHRLILVDFLLRFAAGVVTVPNASPSGSDESSLVMCTGDDFGFLPVEPPTTSPTERTANRHDRLTVICGELIENQPGVVFPDIQPSAWGCSQPQASWARTTRSAGARTCFQRAWTH